MKYKIFLLIVLSSIGFFNYRDILGDTLQKAAFYLAVGAGLFVGMRSGTRLRYDSYPRIPYIILLASIAFSAVMATAFHPQSLKASLVTTLPFLVGYGSFFVLMKLDLPRRQVMNTYLVLCGVSAVVYFCNVLTMPNNIFGTPILSMDMTRGIVRIPVVFIEFFPMIVFYAINRWFMDKEKKWLVIAAAAMVMIFLSVIRQVIALTAVLGLWFFFRQVSVAKKLLVAVVAVSVVVFVLPQIPMYKTMIELSEDQRDENDDDENVRIKAWRYYTYENQTSEASYVLGNGVPAFGNSVWGTMMDSETDELNVFAADVGWAGFFWYFGGIATLCLLIILYKAFRKPKPPSRKYLNYWLVFLVITSVASGPVLYYWQILDIAVCLFLVFKPGDDDDDEAPNSAALKETTGEPRKTLWTKYPQLVRNDIVSKS